MSEFASRSFEQAATQYAESLENFRETHELRRGWFIWPDHLAFTCLDTEHFNETLQAWLPEASEGSYVARDGRRIASLRLERGLAFGSFADVEWLKIIEPRPERTGLDSVGVAYAEFRMPRFKQTGFAYAEKYLQNQNIPYEFHENPRHSWLTLALDPQAPEQEVRFGNRRLDDIVAQELRLGKATSYVKGI